MYVNGKQIIILFINGEAVIPSYCAQGKAVTTNENGKLVTVLELCIKGNADSYDLKIGVNGTGFGWVGLLWGDNTNPGAISQNGVVRN